MSKPRWLSTDEQCVWRAFLSVMTLFEQGLDRQLQRDAKMPLSYYVILAMLSESPDRRLRMTDLARVTNTSQSRLSHAVARLEENGLVVRQKSAQDGRSQVATLTDKGFEVLAEAAPGHVDAVRRQLFDVLTDQQLAQLGDVCGSILAALDVPEGFQPLQPPQACSGGEITRTA